MSVCLKDGRSPPACDMCIIACYLCPTCTNDRSSYWYWVWEPLYFWSNSGCRRSASARVQWGSSSPFKGHVFSSRVEVILQVTDPNFHSSTTRCFRNCPTPRSPGFRPAIESEQKYAWQIERIASKCRTMQSVSKRIRNRQNDEKKLCQCHSIVERQVRERSDSQAVSCHNLRKEPYTLCYRSRGLAPQIWANMEKQWKFWQT